MTINATLTGLVLVSTVLSTACSEKQMYNAIQANQKVECNTLPLDEYKKCMERQGQTYEQYEQDRQKILKQ